MATQDKPKKDDPAIALFFKVSIDGYDLGAFTSCKGLSFDVAVEKVPEGGNNGYVHMLPGRISYSNVSFTRSINTDSAKLARWFAALNGTITRTTASITVMSSDGKDIVTWTLRDVIPVKWSGPDLNADGGKVAMETFEIAHHGFLAH